MRIPAPRHVSYRTCTKPSYVLSSVSMVLAARVMLVFSHMEAKNFATRLQALPQHGPQNHRLFCQQGASVAINAPHVQTDCFPMTASMTKVGWNSFFLQQSWSPTMVGVQEFPHTGPLSTQSCLNAVDDFRNDQKDKEGEELRSKADVRVMLGCDKRPHSCVEVDSDVESSLEIPGAENVLWERNTTAEGQWAIQDFSRQTSMSSVTALEANAGPSTTAGAKPEAEARYLTILNTFLHWGPSDSSPATRSKSAGGRVEGVQI